MIKKITILMLLSLIINTSLYCNNYINTEDSIFYSEVEWPGHEWY